MRRLHKQDKLGTRVKEEFEKLAEQKMIELEQIALGPCERELDETPACRLSGLGAALKYSWGYRKVQ